MNVRRFAACAAWLLVSAACLAEDVPVPLDLQPVREAILDGIRNGLAPSLAVAVVKDDRVIWAEGFGFADLEEKLPASADSIYLLASVSKPLTATGLMVLVEKGLVDLDKPANEYLPGAKLRAQQGTADQITLRRLANHTAGLPVHYNFFYAGTSPPSWDETIRRYGFAAHAPGSRWEYSNLAFGLLGFITETVSKRPWGKFLEKEVFDPLGMTHTSDRVRPGCERYATAQYGPDAAGRFLRIEPYGFDHPGASALWSSASDLARFARMHLNGGALDGVRILKEESARAMQRLESRNVPGSGTGIGWAVGKTMGHASFSHSGGMPGVTTMVAAYPDDRAATIVLSNAHDRALVSQVTKRLARALLVDAKGSERSPDPDLPPPPQSLAGTWEGRIEHWDGDIPLRLVIGDCGSVEVSFNGHEEGKLRDAALRGSSLVGRIQAQIRTQAGFHGVPDLEFHLEREGRHLKGVCVALAEGYFALSHWVELEEKGEKAL